MSVHRARCEDCAWSTEGEDLLTVSDKMERHARKEMHEVDLERAVATDGGTAPSTERVGCYLLEFDDGSYHTFGHHYPAVAEELDDATITTAWWDVACAPSVATDDAGQVAVDRDVLTELVDVAKGKVESDVQRWGADATGYDLDAFVERIERAEQSLEDVDGGAEETEPVTGVRLAVDTDRLDPTDDLQYLVSLAIDARREDGHWDGDSTDAAKWAVAQWCQEIGWAPDLQDLDPGEMVPKDDLPEHLDEAFYPPVATDGGQPASDTDRFHARVELANHIYQSVLDPRMNKEEQQFLAQMACLAAAYWPMPRTLQTDSDHEPVTDGGRGRTSIGSIKAADALDVDGEAVLAIKGSTDLASVHVPAHMVEPLKQMVLSLEDIYEDETSEDDELVTDGGHVDETNHCCICETDFDTVAELIRHDCEKYRDQSVATDGGDPDPSDADVADRQTVHVGDHVNDREEPDGASMLVVGVPGERASDYDVRGGMEPAETVADYNPSYPSDDWVVEVAYPERTDTALDTEATYAFPRSRLDIVAPIHDVEEGGED